MQHTDILSSARSLVVVPAPLATTRPIPVNGLSGNSPLMYNKSPILPAPAGTFSITDQFDVQHSTDAGTSAWLRVIPARVLVVGTYTLTIYGWVLIGSRWHNVLLWTGSCTCSITEVDAGATTNSIGNGDQLCSVITPSAAIPPSQYVIIADGVNPATLLVKTNGCPFATFVTSDTAAYVAASAQT